MPFDAKRIKDVYSEWNSFHDARIIEIRFYELDSKPCVDFRLQQKLPTVSSGDADWPECEIEILLRAYRVENIDVKLVMFPDIISHISVTESCDTKISSSTQLLQIESVIQDGITLTCESVVVVDVSRMH